MNTMKTLKFLAFSLMTAFVSSAQGGLIFRFDAANYVGVTGGTVDVTLRLEATDDSAAGGVDHTVLFRSGGMDGLFSTGVFIVNENLADPTSDGATVASVTDININTAVFNDTVGTLGSPGLNFTTVGARHAGAQAVVNDLVEGAQLGTTGPFIVDVATFTYTLGPNPETTNLRLLDFGFEDFNNNGLLDSGEDLNANSFLDVGGDDTNDVLGNVFDGTPGLFDSTATITSIAVPEPSCTIFVLGIAAVGLVRRRRKS